MVTVRGRRRRRRPNRCDDGGGGSECCLEAHLGSSSGRLLVERTLAPGKAVRLRGRRIRLRLGNPTDVRLRLNGQSLKLTPTADPINLLVTPHGAKAA